MALSDSACGLLEARSRAPALRAPGRGRVPSDATPRARPGAAEGGSPGCGAAQRAWVRGLALRLLHISDACIIVAEQRAASLQIRAILAERLCAVWMDLASAVQLAFHRLGHARVAGPAIERLAVVGDELVPHGSGRLARQRQELPPGHIAPRARDRAVLPDFQVFAAECVDAHALTTRPGARIAQLGMEAAHALGQSICHRHSLAQGQCHLQVSYGSLAALFGYPEYRTADIQCQAPRKL